MTDNDIIKALECCMHDDYDYCEECPYLKNKPCQGGLIQDTFDLINRLKTEVEALKAEEKAANHYCKNSCEPKYKANVEGLTNAVKFLNEQLTTAKVEAFKEFAKFLVDKAENGVIAIVDLPDYVIEMVGEG